VIPILQRAGHQLGLLLPSSLLLSLLLLAGCAAVHQQTSVTESTMPRVPTDLDLWDASGKASFTYLKEVDTARFHWRRQGPEQDLITLSGPFSLNSQTIERRDDELLWRDGEQVRPLSDMAPDSTALAALTAIPAESLGRWLLGAQPGSSVWEVDVTEWRAAPPWQAPSRVTIRGTGMEIKVIISQWEFSPAP
jgi:outer membrane biogenesis lipoprotein LolB